ncbi:MAG: tetratricopeptide repeat protein, partial [Planctomycetota bacterium]
SAPVATAPPPSPAPRERAAPSAEARARAVELAILGLDAFGTEGGTPVAARHAVQALALDPENDTVRILDLLLRLRGGDDTVSVDDARSHVQARFADDARLWLYVSLAMNRRRRHAEAATMLEKALALQPDNLQFQAELCATYFELGRLDDAQRCADRVLTLRGSHASHVRILAARIQARRGDPDGAIRALEGVRATSPQSGPAVAVAGASIELDRDDLVAARRFADLAVKLGPKMPLARDVRARVLERQGDREGAIAEADEAFRLDPADPSRGEYAARLRGR